MKSYDLLSSINQRHFENKAIAIVGAGYMAQQYALALSKMKIQDVVIISNSASKVNDLCKRYDFQSLSGGYENHLDKLKKMDLVIIATPIHLLLPAANQAIESGQDNILIEKPASLYYRKILRLSKKLKDQRVRVGYNRLAYPNFQLLKGLIEKEGGATSCTFTFTEWVHTINFSKEKADAYSRWGISNSSHVVSMAFDLIGMPIKLTSIQFGKLDWHRSGSVFVGNGITTDKIPFSYHADWNSAGRWGIEVMTRENAYRLMPLEDLYVCKKGSVTWEKVPFELPYQQVKQGIAEEIAIMLDPELERTANLVDLESAANLNQLAEKIFGY